MIEQLFQLVQQSSQVDIVENDAIPNEYNQEAMSIATKSVVNGLQQSISNNGLGDVMRMLGGVKETDMSNPIVNGISNDFVENIISKLGINKATAMSIASSLIPMILSKLGSQTRDPQNSNFNINDIIGKLTGLNAGAKSGISIPGLDTGSINFENILSSISKGGLDINHDGKTSLDDLSAALGGIMGKKNDNTHGENSAGGMMDILKGFMK